MKTATESRRHRSYLGLFLGQMLRRPGRIGAVSPSSGALAKTMTRDLSPETGSVVEPIAARRFPNLGIAALFPFLPGLSVGGSELGRAQQANGPLKDG